MAKITFFGGAGEVTGANICIETESQKILVDCGLHQGSSFATEEKNAEVFAYDPSTIDALFITHAHADHVGRVPKIVGAGFSGDIYSTHETRALAELVLEDALKIFEDQEKRFGTKPLYTHADIKKALSLWKEVSFHEKVSLKDNVVVHMTPVGHILGAGAVHFVRNGKKLVCTGDIGNSPDILLPHPEAITDADYMVTESVYGDRLHDDRDMRTELLKNIVLETIEQKRCLLIPSFAVHRTQSLLLELNNLVESGSIPAVPVFLDSPLAEKATQIYAGATKFFKESVQAQIHGGDNVFSFPKLSIVKSGHDSELLESSHNPKIIIAGSGMSVGGRVVSHEQTLLSNPSTTMLFVGFQAPGTLGRRIQEGQKKIKFADAWIKVRAKIETIHGYSGHADRDGLMDFIGQSSEVLKKVFVIMGEPRASQFLAQRVHDFLGIEAVAPQERDSVIIDW